MTFRSRVVVPALVSLLVVLVAPALAQAAFGQVQSVVSPSIWVAGWSSAQFRDGSVLAASWLMPRRERFEVDVFTRSGGGSFGAPQRVSGVGDVVFRGGDGFDVPQGLTGNGGGQAVVTWVEDGQARAAIRRPDGTFGPAQRLGAARWSMVWMDEHGNALVLYVTRGAMLRAAVRTGSAMHFSPSRRLGILRGGAGGNNSLGVVKREGGFAFVWDACPSGAVVRDATCRHHVVRASVAPAGRGAGAPQTLGPVDTSSISIRALAGPNGDVVALWSSGRHGSVRTARLARGGTRFGTARIVSHRGLGAFSVAGALGRNGGLAVWIERQRDGHLRAIGSEIDPRGRIGSPFTLSGDEDAVLPGVRVEDDGAAVVFWRREHAIGSIPASWWIRSRAAAGQFTPAVVLPALEGLAVAFDGHGELLALTAVDVSAGRPSGDFTACQWHVETQSSVWPAGTQPMFHTLDDCVYPRRPSLAVDESGRAVGAWTRDTAPNEQPIGRFIRVATRPPGGDFGPAGNASDPYGAQPHTSLTGHHAMLLWGQDATPPRSLRASFDDTVP